MVRFPKKKDEDQLTKPESSKAPPKEKPAVKAPEVKPASKEKSIIHLANEHETKKKEQEKTEDAKGSAQVELDHIEKLKATAQQQKKEPVVEAPPEEKPQELKPEEKKPEPQEQEQEAVELIEEAPIHIESKRPGFFQVLSRRKWTFIVIFCVCFGLTLRYLKGQPTGHPVDVNINVPDEGDGDKKADSEPFKQIDEEIAKVEGLIELQEEELFQLRDYQNKLAVDDAFRDQLDRLSEEKMNSIREEIITTQDKLVKLGKILGPKKDRPFFVSLDETIANAPEINNLRRKLEELEFQRLIVSMDPSQGPILIKEQDQQIKKTKAELVKTIKEKLNRELTPSQEADLALSVKQIILSTQAKVLQTIVSKNYTDAQTLTSRQLDYVEANNELQKHKASWSELLKQKEGLKAKAKEKNAAKQQASSAASAPKASASHKINIYLASTVIGLLFGVVFAFIREKMAS